MKYCNQKFNTIPELTQACDAFTFLLTSYVLSKYCPTTVQGYNTLCLLNNAPKCPICSLQTPFLEANKGWRHGP